MPANDIELTDSTVGDELSGLDRLEMAGVTEESRIRKVWSLTWPKLAAVAIAIGIWQAVVWAEWKPKHALAPPGEAFSDLWDLWKDGTLTEALETTLRRSAVGFAMALVIGTAVGAVVASSRIVRIAVGSMITGLQTMPSIAWFPLAVLLFKRTEAAIYFVVVLGAAPSIANGLITGVDQIPPILKRAGRVLGARGLNSFRCVILPASLPSFMGGLKQGWAFAWRSLMAGELLNVVIGKPTLGQLLAINRDLADSSGLLATMIVILMVGIVIDAVFFGTLDRVIRRRWGLVEGTG
jgi:NitT/TauT family transport system permease protein